MRLISFYLPQYHPIPENDLWWGKGFTEWTNVAKAKPLFPGHKQPKLPADLGFYDLRVPEVRQAQADLARDAGIEGFCYWHYWFAGKELLERPLREVVASGEPDFPFCVAWANQTWSGIWHGAPNEILIEQTYPGDEDHEEHFYSLLETFRDDRYIKVDGKLLFVIFKYDDMPDVRGFIELWQQLAKREQIGGFYFVCISSKKIDYKSLGFDGMIIDTFSEIRRRLEKKPKSKPNILQRLLNKLFYPKASRYDNPPVIYSYKDYINLPLPDLSNLDEYHSIIPNWDNTPRSGNRGIVLTDSSPELFRKHLKNAIEAINDRIPEKRIIFLKSWNEWAEGNYFEPDAEFGRKYLDVIKIITSK